MKNSIKYLVLISFLPILFISITRGYVETNLQSFSTSAENLDDESNLVPRSNLIELPKPKPVPIPIPFPTPGDN